MYRTKKNIFLILFINLFFVSFAWSQQGPTWDNTAKSQWNDAFEEVSMLSSTDKRYTDADPQEVHIIGVSGGILSEIEK